jgi:hypothetical protein
VRANGATKHEIVSPILTKFELGHILAHCLTVMHKIDARVGNHPANRFTLYMNVFPRTLSLPHVATWDTVLVDHPLAAQNVASFHGAIRHFIAAHATDEDHHELLEYICSATKPRKMDVQTYFSCLWELNSHVNWLPGNDLPLTEDQLHQAFLDGMPTIWRERSENAGRSVRNTTCAELQKAADCSQKANKMKEQSENRTRGSRNNDHNSLRFQIQRNPDLIMVRSRPMLSIEASSLRKKRRSQEESPIILSALFTQVRTTRGANATPAPTTSSSNSLRVKMERNGRARRRIKKSMDMLLRLKWRTCLSRQQLLPWEVLIQRPMNRRLIVKQP